MTPPTRSMAKATSTLPEDRPTPMNMAPINVIMLAIKSPYIWSMSRNCDIERGYHGFLYISFGIYFYEGHRTRGIHFLYQNL
jgi:hypothetical protein